jgi:hypothetical protein
MEFSRCLHLMPEAADSVRKEVYLIQRREMMNGIATMTAEQIAAVQE